MKPGLNHLCDAIDNGLYLRLIDGCFVIVKGSQILAKMCCFSGLNSPIDSYDQPNLIIPAHSTHTVFDNKINEYLINNTNLIPYQNRGFILFANYPENDIDGLPVPDEALNLILRVTSVGRLISPEIEEDAEIEITTIDIPWFKFFTSLQNPITNDINKVIDKVEIVNDNHYDVNVNALLINVNRDGSTLDNQIVGCN